MSSQELLMATKKTPPSKAASVRDVNHSLRLSVEDTARVRALADAREWPFAKTLAKLVALALDAKLLK
jgi:hypothetical protein